MFILMNKITNLHCKICFTNLNQKQKIIHLKYENSNYKDL